MSCEVPLVWTSIVLSLILVRNGVNVGLVAPDWILQSSKQLRMQHGCAARVYGRVGPPGTYNLCTTILLKRMSNVFKKETYLFL